MKRNEIKIGAMLSYVTIALNILVGLIYTPVLIRGLGQSEYGLYSLVYSVISYLTILDMGFGNAITIYTAKYIAQKDKIKEKKLHGMFYIIYVIIGIIAFLIGIVLYFNTSNMFGNSLTTSELETAKTLMLILAINMGITFLFSIYGSIITAYEKFVFQKVLNIAKIILQPLIMLPILFMGGKSISLVIIITVLNIIVLMLNMLYAKQKLKIKFNIGIFDKILFFEICGFSFYLFLNTIIDKVNWSVDNFILGIVKGTTEVSIYSVAGQINAMYLLFSTAIAGVLLPRITSMQEKKATDKEFSDIFIQVGRIQYIILGIVLTGFILYGKEFIELVWLGTDYTTAYYIICILIVPSTFSLIQNVGISILQAKGKYKFRSLVLSIIAGINLLVSIPLSQMYGGVGAAIATAGAILIGNVIILNIYYWKKIKIDILTFWKNIIKLTIPIVIGFIVAIISKEYFGINNVSNLIIHILIYALLYIIITFFINMNQYEKNLIISPIKKILRLKNQQIK